MGIFTDVTAIHREVEIHLASSIGEVRHNHSVTNSDSRNTLVLFNKK